LWWVDIPAGSLYRWQDGALTVRQFDENLACIAPMAGGGLLAAFRSGLYRLPADGGGRELLAAAPYDTAVQRFNDGKVGPDGRFWVGTIFEPRTAKDAVLYRYDRRGLVAMTGDVIVSNGLGWSPDGGTLYQSDTRSQIVYTYGYSDGDIGQRRTFAVIAPENGRPDGAAVDAEGYYWSAQFAGGRLYRFAPDGAVDREIKLPVARPTMCAFGGPGLRTLFITSAAEGGEAGPLDGSVIAFEPGVAGLPVRPFDPAV
jgi:sugar lactone lactonase YvrE